LLPSRGGQGLELLQDQGLGVLLDQGLGVRLDQEEGQGQGQIRVKALIGLSDLIGMELKLGFGSVLCNDRAWARIDSDL